MGSESSVAPVRSTARRPVCIARIVGVERRWATSMDFEDVHDGLDAPCYTLGVTSVTRRKESCNVPSGAGAIYRRLTSLLFAAAASCGNTSARSSVPLAPAKSVPSVNATETQVSITYANEPLCGQDCQLRASGTSLLSADEVSSSIGWVVDSVVDRRRGGCPAPAQTSFLVVRGEQYRTAGRPNVVRKIDDLPGSTSFVHVYDGGERRAADRVVHLVACEWGRVGEPPEGLCTYAVERIDSLALSIRLVECATADVFDNVSDPALAPSPPPRLPAR